MFNEAKDLLTVFKHGIVVGACAVLIPQLIGVAVYLIYVVL